MYLCPDQEEVPAEAEDPEVDSAAVAAALAAALAEALEVDTEAASAVPTTIIIITVPDSEADGITIPTAEVITDTAEAVSAVLCLQF